MGNQITYTIYFDMKYNLRFIVNLVPFIFAGSEEAIYIIDNYVFCNLMSTRFDICAIISVNLSQPFQFLRQLFLGAIMKTLQC